MKIIGLENCGPCKILKSRNPSVDYIEVPRTGRARTPDELKAKKLMSKAPELKFPQICDDAIEKLLPRDSLGSWE